MRLALDPSALFALVKGKKSCTGCRKPGRLTEKQCGANKIAPLRFTDGPMISVTIDSPNPDIGPQWDDLIRRASPNVFMNPAALKAASETGFSTIKVLLAWEQGAGQRKLVGVWALRLRQLAPFWPIQLEALPYNYAFVSSPVVDPACIDAVIAAFFAAIENSPALPRVVSLPSLDGGCPSYPAMRKHLAERGGATLALAA